MNVRRQPKFLSKISFLCYGKFIMNELNEETKSLGLVAVIGRPNVGKSTLFNRLLGSRVAIETPIPGTTRDRLEGEVRWQSDRFDLMDVAGWEGKGESEMDQAIFDGINIAITEADLILFVVDYADLNDQDLRIASVLRRSKKEVLLVVNKVDNTSREQNLEPFGRLGMKMVAVSAISGRNTGELSDIIVHTLKKLPQTKEIKKENTDIRLAIIGRPNVGKSTLLNNIIGAKRVVTSSEPGTTRDTIDVMFHHKGKKILITDTAGIRRPGKISKDSIESYSVLRSLSALRKSDLAVLVIDAGEGVVALEESLLGKAKDWGKGIILAINKIDLVENKDKFMSELIWQLQKKLNFIPWLPIVFISAQEGENVQALLNQVIKVSENRRKLIDSEILAQILEDANNLNPQLGDIMKLEQKSTNPPAFEVVYKGKKVPHYTQLRYLENKIRDVFPLNGTPIYLDLVHSK